MPADARRVATVSASGTIRTARTASGAPVILAMYARTRPDGRRPGTALAQWQREPTAARVPGPAPPAVGGCRRGARVHGRDPRGRGAPGVVRFRFEHHRGAGTRAAAGHRTRPADRAAGARAGNGLGPDRGARGPDRCPAGPAPPAAARRDGRPVR